MSDKPLRLFNKGDTIQFTGKYPPVPGVYKVLEYNGGYAVVIDCSPVPMTVSVLECETMEK